MPPARVISVAPGSPAAHAGVLIDDEIVAVNGEALTDVIRYHFQVDEPQVEIDVSRAGASRTLTVTKGPGVPLGLELATAVFDRVRTCDNHCPFCFIHQLPRGMRASLYVRDDDYRLSFLYGNFTTLTRFTELDLERVVDERLSPLYVSIHSTDPELRAQLLRNPRGATSLRWLSALLDAGIEVHGQVVVCPDLNDGAALDDTMLGILDRFPKLASVGVVPLGVSQHNAEPGLRPHTRAEAEAVVDVVESWQRRFTDALDTRMVFVADEYYLLAGRPFPTLESYEGCSQHENGVGIARTFEEELKRALVGDTAAGTGARSGFFSWVDGAPSEGYRAERTSGRRSPRSHDEGVTLVTGRYGEAVLAPLLASVREGRDIDVLGVDNRFFGGNIAVTGLLTGHDVGLALTDAPTGRRYLVPDVMLSDGRFLDGSTPAELPRPIEVVRSDGVSLARALNLG